MFAFCDWLAAGVGGGREGLGKGIGQWWWFYNQHCWTERGRGIGPGGSEKAVSKMRREEIGAKALLCCLGKGRPSQRSIRKCLKMKWNDVCYAHLHKHQRRWVASCDWNGFIPPTRASLFRYLNLNLFIGALHVVGSILLLGMWLQPIVGVLSIVKSLSFLHYSGCMPELINPGPNLLFPSWNSSLPSLGITRN